MHTRIAGGCLYHACVALGKPIKTERAIRLSKNLIALYFYNNSNYVAILLPKSIYNRQKPSKIRLFHGCEITPTRSIQLFTKLFCLVNISFLYRQSNCFLLSFCNSKFTVSKQYHHLPYRLYCIIGAYRSQHFKVIKLSFISV